MSDNNTSIVSRYTLRRNLKPNVAYYCEVCGTRVEKYISPSDQRKEVFALRFCGMRCKGLAQRGEKHPMWKGGQSITDQGYVEIYSPDHPFATERGYVRKHRLVMEEYLGRYLDPVEVVHHENDDTRDNRIENLKLFASNAEHKRHEDAERLRDQAGRYLPVEKGKNV